MKDIIIVNNFWITTWLISTSRNNKYYINIIWILYKYFWINSVLLQPYTTPWITDNKTANNCWYLCYEYQNSALIAADISKFSATAADISTFSANSSRYLLAL